MDSVKKREFPIKKLQKGSVLLVSFLHEQITYFSSRVDNSRILYFSIFHFMMRTISCLDLIRH